MTAPAQTFACLGAALGIGWLLGIVYAFLIPLGKKRRHLADLLFVS